jgi:hypothetical protein
MITLTLRPHIESGGYHSIASTASFTTVISSPADSRSMTAPGCCSNWATRPRRRSLFDMLARTTTASCRDLSASWRSGLLPNETRMDCAVSGGGQDLKPETMLYPAAKGSERAMRRRQHEWYLRGEVGCFGRSPSRPRSLFANNPLLGRKVSNPFLTFPTAWCAEIAQDCGNSAPGQGDPKRDH